MPCRDDGYSDYYMGKQIEEHRKQAKSQQKRLDMYAQMLCAQCKKLELAFGEEVLTPEVREWWTQHKIDDALRIQKEAEEAEKKRKKEEEKAAKIRAAKLEQFMKLKDELGL